VRTLTVGVIITASSRRHSVGVTFSIGAFIDTQSKKAVLVSINLMSRVSEDVSKLTASDLPGPISCRPATQVPEIDLELRPNSAAVVGLKTRITFERPVVTFNHRNLTPRDALDTVTREQRLAARSRAEDDLAMKIRMAMMKVRHGEATIGTLDGRIEYRPPSRAVLIEPVRPSVSVVIKPVVQCYSRPKSASLYGRGRPAGKREIIHGN
jgi:hypothetical protein